MLRAKYGAQVELVASSGGVFEISVEGKLLFSKKQLHRFPVEGELELLIDRR